jgi:sn-glycerol 3-phosphate transport system ATP-binding protein
MIEGSDVPMTLRLPGSTVAARGDRLHVAPAEGRLHLFSKDTGKRL